jgi:hypothetical protein
MRSLTKDTVFSLTLTVLLLLLPMMAGAQAQRLSITNGPVVEDAGPTSAEIAWTTSTGGSTVLRYGTDPNNLNQTAEEPYAAGQGGQHVTHRVKVHNLQPNTTYYFQVVSGQGQGTGTQTQSQVGQFTTNATGAADKVPLYRAYNSGNNSHVFTQSYSEVQKAVSAGWKNEGIAGYIDRKQAPGTTPLYRAFNPGNGDHFYTADANERNRALSSGYQDEGIAGYIATSQQPGTTPLYRLFNGSEHFYTTNPGERQTNLQSGWRDEGVAGYISQH